MAEEKGFVTKNLEAVLTINLSYRDSIDCTIDTGFSGSLMLPRKIVEDNAMIIVGREEVELVDEITTEIDTALGRVKWFSEDIWVRLFVSETGESLIGTEMLKDSKLEIDYIENSVKIIKPQQ